MAETQAAPPTLYEESFFERVQSFWWRQDITKKILIVLAVLLLWHLRPVSILLDALDLDPIGK